MVPNVSRLVIASRLETQFLPGCVKHTLTRYTLSQSPPAEEVWDVESTIGRGTFGVVRIERCRKSRLGLGSPPHQVRAVKVISKSDDAVQRWDYTKELEAIVRFSLPQYAPYFVRSYGWFENDQSVFIAMEYLPLGDLRRFMDTRPQFSEEATQQIVRQLLRGIRFMHESGFAHRDLKPANILVASDSPRWTVKIADFGISKQMMEGRTRLQTLNIGTPGYMPPEVFNVQTDNSSSIAYSVAVDIWAVGIIVIELLLKRHPLPSIGDLFGLFHGLAPLITDTATGSILSEDCREFVRQLLNTNPVKRLTANAALSHPWLEEVIPDSDDEESLFVTDDLLPRSPLSQVRHAATPASLPSLAWSNLRLSENSTSTTQATGTLLGTYQGPTLDSRLLLRGFQGFSLETSKYFVMRSDNPIDIETSAAHNVWTSSSRVNGMLDRAWNATDGQVILFFSVIKSQKFCGVAQMTSGMDWANTDEHWLEDVWQGRFTLRWLCLTELPFEGVKHVPVKVHTRGFRAIACFDGTEICTPSGFELLRAFSARERENESNLITPPATLTPIHLDTIASSVASLPSRADRRPILSPASPSHGRALSDTRSRSDMPLEFSSILRSRR